MSEVRTPKTILITGATGGIGGALAEIYAEPGKTLILQGRNTVRLAELATMCEAHGARVLTHALDVCKHEELRIWLNDICLNEQVDLVIVNAGVNINTGREAAGECWKDINSLINVNILAAMATVDGVLPSMRERGAGQIALISSLAAYYGLPVTPSYCASKAAIKVYGEALRGWLEKEGILVNVVMPGYVKSKMCDDMPGPKPFLWSACKAARFIRRGLERDRPRISFPFPLNFGSWWLGVLPPSISQRILQLIGYRG